MPLRSHRMHCSYMMRCYRTNLARDDDGTDMKGEAVEILAEEMRVLDRLKD